MRNLVPSFISDQFERGHFQGRFNATTLFIDISGFTATTNALMQYGTNGAEVMAQVMRAIFNPLVDQVHEWGGFIANFAGDAFTAIFLDNEPESHVRALRAAVEIQAYMRNQPMHSTKYGEFLFAVKTGLADGEVEWGVLRPGKIKPNQVASYYFSGSAIDGCAKAEHQAKAGDLILSLPLWEKLTGCVAGVRVNGHFRVESVDQDALYRAAVVGSIMIPATSPESFVVEAIRQQITSGEFRPVLTLFLQLASIETHEQLAEFVQTVFRLQGQYGGHLNTIDFGDKGCTLLLFWGMPTSFENDVERALNFVWGLKQEAVLSFRAGVTYRVMYAGFVGADSRQEYSCYGRGVNLAARLMMSAPEGSVWLDVRTARQGEQRFRIESLGRFAYKGFEKRQPTYVLLEPKLSGGRFFEGQLVGREAELTRLVGGLNRVFEGAPAGITIVRGEAGIGKSRLVHTAKKNWRQSAPGPFKWLLGQTDQILQQSLNPFRYLLQHYFRREPATPFTKAEFEAVFDPLVADVADSELVEELERTRSFLAAILGVTWPGSLYSQLEPKARFENTLNALRVFFQAESRRQPLVIQIEDVQWLDNDSVTFITYMRGYMAGFAMALLLTSRPGTPPKLLDEAKLIDLTPLNKTHLNDLTFSILGQPAAPPLLDLLEQRTDGNPFFVEQTLHYLNEQNLLTATGEGLQPASVTDLILPTDVRTILTSRIDRLAPTVKDTVQTAAILGREFETPILDRIRAPVETQTSVSHATQAGVWVAMNETRYLFKHALMRDAAYGMQLVSHRRQLHQRAARVIEKYNQDNIEAYYGALAYHYEQAVDEAAPAEVRQKACTYLELAGDLAREAFQNTTAINYYQRLLTLQEQHSNDLALKEKRKDVLRKQGIIWVGIGELNSAEQAFRESLDLAKAMQSFESLALAQRELGRILALRGDFGLAMTYHQAALSYFQSNNHDEGHAKTLREIGVTYWRNKQLTKAIEQYRDALQIYELTNDRPGKAQVMGLLGIALRGDGQYAQALVTYKDAQEIQEELGDIQNLADLLGNMGFLYWRLGDYEQAERAYNKALTLSQKAGSTRAGARNLGNLGLVYRDKGDYGEALKHLDQAVELAQKLQSHVFLCPLLVYKASVLLADNQLETAQAVNEQGLDFAIQLNYQEFIFNARVQNAKIALALGNQSASLQQLQDLLEKTLQLGEQATLLYELWLVTDQTFYAERALDFYRKLAKHTPDVEYQERIDSLLLHLDRVRI